MLDELEKSMQGELEKDFPGVSKLRADFAGKVPPGKVTSVAEQLLSVAESIKAIHAEIDALEKEMGNRLNSLRKSLGSKG